MKNFIEIIDIDAGRHLININHIMKLKETNQGTKIELGTERAVNTTTTFEEVRMLITNAQK